MILLDSDVMIDLFREYSPAKIWFDSIENSETMALSGFVVMELIQGCNNKVQLEKLQRDLAFYETVWLEADNCEKALDMFAQYYLSHNAGLVDVLVEVTAVSLDVPLYTFNDKHYQFIPGLKTVQPYLRS
jgi:predicted nucleic acid-binding protein